MTPERWRAVKAIFDQLQSVSADGRHAWLDSAGEVDPEVRRDLAALLEADQSAKAFLEAPPLTDIRAALETHLHPVPEHIGPYRVRRELGRGGMGVVYLASRDDGAYEKDVAIKLARAGFDSELLRRFHCERQILADLDHPNIARLLDGGTTGQGYPYLVMEYVDGEPITGYCDRHRLPVPDRMRLFQAVCTAVQHAHERRIIHRDLKPANILITRNGAPKLLDFGIAKLLVPDRGRGPMTLTSGIHPMTPDYASPEQVHGGTLTPASDCYALAVILYELLSGARPYAGAGGSPFAVARAILDCTPERPSARAYRGGTLIAGPRGTTPDRLRRALQGDIDNIVLMALRKEPERRYTSAAALADDIRRHLEFFPVAARKDAAGYRMSAFVRRNRRLVATAGVAALALSAVTGVALWRDRRAMAERHVAERRAHEAGQFGMSLLNDVFRNEKKAGAASPRPRKRPLPLPSGGLPGQPARDEDLQANLAWIYGYKGAPRMNQGRVFRNEDARRRLVEYQRACRVLEPLFSAEPADAGIGRLLALTYERQAYAQSSVDVTSSLESHRRQVLASERLVRLQPDPPVQVYLATAVRSLGERLGHPYYGNVGDTAAARREIERATRIAEQWVPGLPTAHEGTWYLGYCYASLAGIVWAQGDIDSAIALQQRAIQAFEDLPQDSPNRTEIQSELGMIHVEMANFLHQAGHPEKALHSVGKAIGILEPLFRQDPENANLRRYLIGAYNQSGHVWLDLESRRATGWYRQAEQLGIDWLARHSHAPEVRERLAESRSGMARALAALGESARAEEKSRQAVEIAGSLAELDSRNAHYRFSLVQAHLGRGEVMEKLETAAAAEEYRKGLSIAEAMSAADPASRLKRHAVAGLKDRLKRLAPG